MNPYAILAIVLILVSSHTGVYFYGVKNGKNEIIAEQKKAQDKAIAQHQEVAKNDLTQAIKVTEKVQKSEGTFRGILQKTSALDHSRTNCPIDPVTFELLNTGNRGAAEANPTSKPAG